MSKLVRAHTHTPHYTRCGARCSHCYLVQCTTHKRTVESKVIQYTKQARDTVKSHPTLKTQAHGVDQPYSSRNTRARCNTTPFNVQARVVCKCFTYSHRSGRSTPTRRSLGCLSFESVRQRATLLLSAEQGRSRRETRRHPSLFLVLELKRLRSDSSVVTPYFDHVWTRDRSRAFWR